MKSPLRFAVTTDMSEFSKRSFGPAVSLARKFAADLHLVHQDRLTTLAAPEQIADYFVDVERQLEKLASSGDLEGSGVTPRLIRESHILALADALADYDLVITATHGRTGLQHLLLGSFAEKLVRVSSSPVLVTRGEGGAFEPKRILVAHDFTKSTMTSVEVAYDWAQRFSAEIKFLTVVPELDSAVEARGGWAGYHDIVRRNALAKLEEIAGEERWQELLVEVDVAVGSPISCIVNEARDFDLVVVGRHGHLYREKLFLGNVAERVLRGVSCSVLVVEHHE